LQKNAFKKNIFVSKREVRSQTVKSSKLSMKEFATTDVIRENAGKMTIKILNYDDV